MIWDDKNIFHELNGWKEDQKLKELIKSCILMQQEAARSYYESEYKLSPMISEETSPQKLDQILAKGLDIHGIATEREISNCIVFNAKNIDDAIQNEELERLRANIDQIVKRKVNELFQTSEELVVTSSGHFWYPPGGFMGWHTNTKAPGWRLYINYAKEPHKSFFRYRDPATEQIITSRDEEFNFRLFRIHPSIPLWHCVSSDTDRFSIGYRIRKESDVNPSIWKRLINSLVGPK